MGCCNGISRHRASPTSSVMLRRLRRLRVTAIFYTCVGLCAILLLVNFNEDVKRLLQQSSSSNGPHLTPSSGSHSLSGSSQSLQLQQFQQQHSASSSGSNGKVLHFPQPLAEVNSNDVINFKGENSGSEDGGGGKTFDPPATGPSYLMLDDPEKPWFMWGGTKYPSLANGFDPSAVDEAKLWYEDNLNNDRIVEQLMFMIDDPINNPNSSFWFDGETTLPTSTPPNKGETGLIISGSGGGSSSGNSIKTTLEDESAVAPSTGNSQMTSGGPLNTLVQNDSATSGRSRNYSNQRRGKVKTILLYYGLGMSWGAHITSGRSAFLQQKCPVNACRLTGNRAHLSKADVVVYKDVFMNPKIKRNPSQIWVMYMLECPLNTQNFADKNVFNMTATYRHDSDIVTPYEKWVYYDENVKTLQQGKSFQIFSELDH